MKLPFYFFALLQFCGIFGIKAQPLNDTVFHQSSFVISGEIKNISATTINDPGMGLFFVSIQTEHVYKQNSHINMPLTVVNWQVPESYCYKQELDSCVAPYAGKKWIFLLEPGHFSGNGAVMDSLRIIPYTEVNHAKALLLAEEELIKINPYAKVPLCSENCKFCRKVYNERWKYVKRKLTKGNRLKIPLHAHESVKYVIPMGTVLASLPSHGNVTAGFYTKNGIKVKTMGYQLGYSRRFLCLFHFEDVNWSKLRSFGDGEAYEAQLISALRQGIEWQCMDTVHFPLPDPVWKPGPEHIRLWYTTEWEKDRYCIADGKYVPRFTREYLSCMEKDSFVYGLCLLNLHADTEVRIWGLQVLRRLKDKRCIPYLLGMVGYYANIYPDNDKKELFQVYLNELILTLDELTGCRTPVPFGTSLEQFRLSLGLPVWQSKVMVME